MDKTTTDVFGAAVVAVFTGITLALRYALKKIGEKKRAEYDPTPLLKRDRRIMETITELRVRLYADRVAVFQFHNGNYFSSGNPIWRVSCTHETCSPGVAYRANEQRAIIASNLLDIIMPIFGHKVEGVTKHPCNLCLTCTHEIWHCDTEKMAAGPSKAMLQSQGVDFSIRTAIYCDTHRIGYLAVTWDKKPTGRPADAKLFCDTVDILGYLLSKANFSEIMKKSEAEPNDGSSG